MSFNDAELSCAMEDELVDAGVVSVFVLPALLDNPTEVQVREQLTQAELDAFPAYWAALGAWMAQAGGDQALTTGQLVPGRVDAAGQPATVPQGIPVIVLYNDAFRDVNAHIGQPDFSAVKAICAQLRFAKNLGPEIPDESSDEDSSDGAEPDGTKPSSTAQAALDSPWTGTARGGFALQVSWVPGGDGTEVAVTVAQTGGPGTLSSHQATLNLKTLRDGIWRFGTSQTAIEVSLKLSNTISGQQADLWIDYPLTSTGAAHQLIGQWPITQPAS